LDHVVLVLPYEGVAPLSEDSLIARQECGIEQGFALIRALFALGYGGLPLHWTVLTTASQLVVAGEALDPTHAGVHGLMGSLAKEQANWKVRLVDLPAEDPWPLDTLLALAPLSSGDAWSYRRGKWYRRHLIPVEVDRVAVSPWRTDGVYVVIGGAGGLGRVWTEHVVRACGAQVVWIGRRAADEVIAAAQDEVAAQGLWRRYMRVMAGSTGLSILRLFLRTRV
jgi:acyl transferase domain-containing protein